MLNCKKLQVFQSHVLYWFVFTIDSATDGKCFFQEYIGSDHVEILEPLDKYKENINAYTAIYLQTLLNFYLDKYEYSRKRAHIRINK